MNKKILEIKKVKKIFHHNDRKIELFKDVNNDTHTLDLMNIRYIVR